MDEDLTHVGTPRHSGRYPWGSGKNPRQRNKSFLGYVSDLKKEGLKDKDIAKGLGLKTQQLRARKSIAKDAIRKDNVDQATRLKKKGWSNVEIGKRMGINESSVRALLNPVLQERAEITNKISNVLKAAIDKKEYIDVGVGTELHMGINRNKLKTAIEVLKEQGYTTHYIDVEQLGTGKQTSIMVLAKPGVPYQEVYKNKDKIRMVPEYSNDGGRSFDTLKPIRSVDSKKVVIRYAEEGGADKDGLIELRRGVPELSLGLAKYAQVRIGVDGTHYMKGMAAYSDDIPNGANIIFNTNKKAGTSKTDVLKPIKDDPENPFGAIVRQKEYIDANGKKQLSSLNIVNEEGDWGKWSKTLSSQMLSKQTPSLAKTQLEMAFNTKKEEYQEIMSLTNPSVKKKLLEAFSSDLDSSVVHLKAASLPRQASHVILPFANMKDTEIYAPNYRNGEKVVLIRYPHGGIFEIPELTVNNKNKEAKRTIENAKDAVGISPKTAARLSGADFDGDSVLVIPNNNKLIKTGSPLKGLENFDPQEAYKGYEGMPKMSKKTKALQMGNVSNLITDMTIKGANNDELARAVRHSMVVIDAEKHNLDYKLSHINNNIADLKKRYQGKSVSGAATLISRAASDIRVNVRKESVDPATGKKIYTYTGETYTNKKGIVVNKTTPSYKISEVDDAFKLSSGTPMESIYALHANKLKALANSSRKAQLETKDLVYSPSAKVTYAKEVATLQSKLNIALKNKPFERQAQLLANTAVSAKRANNPDMEKADLKKLKGMELTKARSRVGADKKDVVIEPKEWSAIQAGALRPSVLKQILNNTDLDMIKRLATPRTAITLTPAKEARAKAMVKNGYTQSEIADALGISTTLLAKTMQ